MSPPRRPAPRSRAAQRTGTLATPAQHGRFSFGRLDTRRCTLGGPLGLFGRFSGGGRLAPRIVERFSLLPDALLRFSELLSPRLALRAVGTASRAPSFRLRRDVQERAEADRLDVLG